MQSHVRHVRLSLSEEREKKKKKKTAKQCTVGSLSNPSLCNFSSLVMWHSSLCHFISAPACTKQRKELTDKGKEDRSSATTWIGDEKMRPQEYLTLSMIYSYPLYCVPLFHEGLWRVSQASVSVISPPPKTSPSGLEQILRRSCSPFFFPFNAPMERGPCKQ